MVDNAYYCRRTQSLDAYKDQTARLISEGYYAIERYYSRAAYSSGRDFTGYALGVVRTTMLCLMGANFNISSSKEYDVYCRFCNKSGYNPSSFNGLLQFETKLTTREYVIAAQAIIDARNHIDSTNYQNLIYGFIMLAIIDDGQFTEEIYEFIKLFFNSSEDVCPSYRALMSEVYG